MSAPSRLHHLAQRVATDSHFLGSHLAAYRAAHDLDEAAMAAFLGLDLAGLDKLALCRAP